MTRTIGLDVHKKFTEIAILTEEKGVVSRSRIPSTPKAIRAFAAGLAKTDKLALESSTNAFAFSMLLRRYVDDVTVSNPFKTRIIAEAKVKTDKVDAETLARLAAADFLPGVWEPDERTRRIRHQVAHREALSRQRTQVKNRIHSILHRNLVEYDFSDLFGKSGRAFLETAELPAFERAQLDSDLKLLDFISLRIEEAERGIAKEAHPDEYVQLLLGIPGIRFVTALGIKAAIGDASRFDGPDRLVSYLGLNPSVHQSGNSSYHGPITKRGRSHARWLLIEAAEHAAKAPGPLRAFFLRLKSKKGHNVAKVAVARKLAVVIWHMLTKKEPYYYAPPKKTEEKKAALRVLATGQRKKGGLPKGAPRPANYGTGKKGRDEQRARDYDDARAAEEEYKAFVKERSRETAERRTKNPEDDAQPENAGAISVQTGPTSDQTPSGGGKPENGSRGCPRSPDLEAAQPPIPPPNHPAGSRAAVRKGKSKSALDVETNALARDPEDKAPQPETRRHNLNTKQAKPHDERHKNPEKTS